MLKTSWILGLLIFITSYQAMSQGIKGFIKNERGIPIPYANIFVPQLETGTNADQSGKYFLILQNGLYRINISAIGYQSTAVDIVVTDNIKSMDFTLKISETQLDEIIVKSKRKDPAYEIIQFTIDNKKKYMSQISSAKSSVYIKAIETLDQKDRDRLKEEKASKLEISGGPAVDIFDQESKDENNIYADINMLEMKLILNYQYPDKYKEARTGYTLYGKSDGLFIPNLSDVNYNFYENLVFMKGIAEVPIISPIAKTAILSYRYKLENTTNENGIIVYKIKVIPRKSGNATCEGYIYINDGIWNINRLELTLNKGGLKFFDRFEISQSYQSITDSLWLPINYEFNYQTKQNRWKTFKGNTVIHYDDYEVNIPYPNKFFGNEVSSITKEAYDRDSVFWQSNRAMPLTDTETNTVAYRDSIEAVHNSKKYLDSIEARYNAISLVELFFEGIGFRNNERKSHLYLGSISSLINFEVVGGWRLGPYVHYFRRWESEKILNTWSNFSIGLKNSDFMGNLGTWLRYDPYHLGDVWIRAGRNFQPVNAFDAYLNQLKLSNYIIHNYLTIGHRFELFNGFYLFADFNYHDRKSIEHLDGASILNKVIDETEPLRFDPYQALITTVNISYTPGQKYMREPNRKVVLGSKFPTFGLSHKKGWNHVLKSDIDFDYFDFSLKQDIYLGVVGNSKYNITVGKFTNTKDLRYVDLKRFRQSDPYLFSVPMNSFQLLDTSLVASDLFLEAHHIHHFNGALINNIPFIKKLKIRMVAGAGFLWSKENDYKHAETFAGIERIFKLGARRRLKIGVYGVAAASNKTKTATDFKISFDIIDTWKKDWSY